MTKAELIKYLEPFPDDVIIMRKGDEYNGDERHIIMAQYRKEKTLGNSGNSILLS